MTKFLILLICCFQILSFASSSNNKLKVSSLSLEEKVGQLLIAHFEGLDINDEAKTLIENCHVGGIIYYSFSNPFENPEQVQSLSMNLQKLAKSKALGIPLFICADQEGGLVNRLEHGFTRFPAPKAIANSGDLELAKLSAKALGKELKTVGVNLNLAPVVDVNSPENPVIGIRSFGSKTSTVIDFAKAFLKGFRAAHVISCLKHFPGHGDVKTDSHEALPVCLKTKEALERCELQPYRALHLKADCIMTAHVLYPELDAKYCATLSKPILHTLLRKQLGFTGVVISDSLIMDGILENIPTIEEAAVEAIKAGCDMLILGGKKLIGNSQGFELKPEDVEKIHKHLYKAVLDGKITESRINRSVERILKLKKSYHLFTESYPKKDAIKTFVGTHKNRALSKEIAALSLKSITNKTFSEKFDSFVVLAPTLLSNVVLSSTLANLCKTVVFYDNINPSDEEIQQIKNQLHESKNVLFLSYKAWKYENQQSLLKALDNNANIIVTTLADSLDESCLKDFCNHLISIENPTPQALNAVYDHIETLKPQKDSP